MLQEGAAGGESIMLAIDAASEAEALAAETDCAEIMLRA